LIVSWKWGNGTPSGTVAEKKTEGQVAITSKRGNVIKKNASPGNPAVHIERSGNDVVKRVSEVTVDEKAAQSKTGKGQGEKRKAHSQDDTDSDAEEDEGPSSTAGESKKASDNGKEPSKRQKKKEQPMEATEETEGSSESGDIQPEVDSKKETKRSLAKASKKEKEVDPGKQSKMKQTNEKQAETTNSKPKNAKPASKKASGKAKKDPAPRQEGDLVSTRTRSRAKS
jgi:hypothetical protein